MNPVIGVIPTGAANTASMLVALRRVGATPSMIEHPDRVRQDELVVLPGVGSFGAAIRSLREQGFDDAIRDRIRADRPTLCVCVGLQVLCRRSEESPGEEGLAVLDADVTRFDRMVRVPQMGWNRVTPDRACHLLVEGDAYFANSFRVQNVDIDGAGCAWSDHGGRFLAALERSALLACQFHPELSGRYGLDLLTRWTRRRQSC
jgi:glutamine amidotransferase